jgi:hypothetical protein
LLVQNKMNSSDFVRNGKKITLLKNVIFVHLFQNLML